MTDQANLEGGGNDDQQGLGGNNTPAWAAQLDGDLQKNEKLTSFKTIGEMGKAFLETSGKLENAIFPPGENATDEDRAAFYNKLGRPETLEGYSISKPEGIPDEFYNTESEASFRKLSHETGLTDAQAQGLHEWYWNVLKEGIAQEQAAMEKSLNTLKDEWKGDAFKTNSELANRVFEKFGGKEEAVQEFITAKVNGVPIKDHPVFVKYAYEMAKLLSDDVISTGERGSSQGVLSDEDRAKQRFPTTYGKG
jgi:hypothetical protein